MSVSESDRIGQIEGARLPRRGRGFYYGWVVVAVTFLTLVVSSGIRTAPSVFIIPWEQDLGWNRAAISLAVSIGLLLFGLSGPVAGRLMDRYGPRKLMLFGLGLVLLGTAPSLVMTELWQLDLLWGVLSGIGTGLTTLVLGATVANRWFLTRRGLVVGLFGAASSLGQLSFVPLLVWLVGSFGWRTSTLVLAGLVLLAVPFVLILMRDDPADLGLRPYGALGPVATDASAAPAAESRGIMRRALRVPEFWLLSGSFFVCGATTIGLIGTHFIPHSVEHGIPQTTAAGALALMGGMNFVGTLVSGWLTDRYDPRKLLAVYYAFRGLSLFLLPFVNDFAGLTLFAILFGLDYIATVPPTVALCADVFGRKHVGVVFGWVFCAHQIGAASVAYLAGLARTTLGDYQLTFLSAGLLALVAAGLALGVNRTLRAPPAEPVSAAAEA